MATTKKKTEQQMTASQVYEVVRNWHKILPEEIFNEFYDEIAAGVNRGKDKVVERNGKKYSFFNFIEQNPNHLELFDALNEKRFKIQDTNQSYRTINHWSDIGLIDDDRSGRSRGWREFSVVDLVWIAIIAELRKYGFSLEKIAKTRQALFVGDVPTGIYQPHLENALISVLEYSEKKQVYVFETGGTLCMTPEEFQFHADVLPLSCKSYLQIDLKRIVDRTSPALHSLGLEYENDLGLSASDLQVLGGIHSRDVKSIKIVLENGKADRIEWDKDVPIETAVMDALSEAPYQKLQIQLRGGRIAYIGQTITRKVGIGATGRT